MDDIVLIANREVQIQFEFNRFSDRTLALVYQHLLRSVEQECRDGVTFLVPQILLDHTQPIAEVTP